MGPVLEKEVLPDSAGWELQEVIFVPRMSGLVFPGRRQRPGWLMTDARHGNSILNNEQQVFTLLDLQENAEEKCKKVLEKELDWAYL